MAQLLLPLHHYDESGRLKPPRYFWWAGLFLAKSYFVFVLSLTSLGETDRLLKLFYPEQGELYVGLGIGLLPCLLMAMVAYREKWWNSSWRFIGNWIIWLMLLSASLDTFHQWQVLEAIRWAFSWSVAINLIGNAAIVIWVLKSKHLRYMVQDWTND